MYNFLYCEINIIGIFILFIILLNQHHYYWNKREIILFNHVVISIILILITDSAMWLIDGRSFKYCRQVEYLIATMYFTLNVTIPFLWANYSYYVINKKIIMPNYKYIIHLIPLFVEFLFVVTNHSNHYIFYYDELNKYTRGDYISIIIACSCFYLFYSAFIALTEAIYTDFMADKKQFIWMASFMILPLVGTVIQMQVYSLSLIWICAAVSLLMVFINYQNRQISKDNLTGLNTRFELNKYIKNKSPIFHRYDVLGVLMIDINDFKHINDNYGHMKGDVAIAKVAEAIKGSCKYTNDFACRYGGDEYLIICHRENVENIKVLISDIHKHLETLNNAHKLEFNITVSIGFSVCNKYNIKTYDLLISEADKEMYKNKNKYKTLKGTTTK